MANQPVVIDLVSSSDEDERVIFVRESASAKRASVEEASGLHSKRIKINCGNSDGITADDSEFSSPNCARPVAKDADSVLLLASTQNKEIDIYRGDGDNGILSKCVILGTTPGKKYDTSKQLIETFQCTTPLAHIQQRDKWSCGFRNFQMILLALIPQLSRAPMHPFFGFSDSLSVTVGDPTGSNVGTGHSTIRNIAPSVLQIQQIMESSWKNGFDATGKDHFNGRIYKKKSKIGAMEVSSLSSYLSLDSTVVQFIVCHASRSMMGKFLWHYFKRINHTSRETRRESSGEIVEQVMGSIESRVHDIEVAEIKSSIVLPVYLQWEGHSVTVVGIERHINADEMDSTVYDLLIFDPMKKYEEKYSGTCYSTLSTKVTMKKDCQLVIFATKSLSDTDRSRRRIGGGVVTAAHDEVQRVVLKT